MRHVASMHLPASRLPRCTGHSCRAAKPWPAQSSPASRLSLGVTRQRILTGRKDLRHHIRVLAQTGNASQLGSCDDSEPRGIQPWEQQLFQASSSEEQPGQRGGENDTRDCQSASTSAVCCQWPRPTQQLDVSFQSARCAFLTSSFDDEGSNFDFSEEEGLASESSLGPCPHEAHAVAWDGYLQTCTDGGEELSMVPGQIPTHTLSDLSHWCGGSSQLQAHVMPNIHELEQVYVLMFGVGSAAVEGVHTIRALDVDHGSASDTVVAFEARDDAERYATLLEASMVHAPQVSAIQVPELIDFCAEAGHQFRLEAAGTLLIPPSFNVTVTDWERSIRLRNGEFSVLEEDPMVAAPSAPQAALGSAPEGLPGAAAAPAATPEPSPTFGTRSEALRYTEAEVVDIRQRLELLLADADSC